MCRWRRMRYRRAARPRTGPIGRVHVGSSEASRRSLRLRRGSVFAAALLAMALALACSSENGGTGRGQSEPPVRPASAEEFTTYVEIFDAVAASVAEVAGELEALAALMAGSDRPRSTFEADARLLIDGVRAQIDRLQSVQFIPTRAEAAHGSMKLALERYVEAAMLLLPPRHGGPDLLDFSTFDEKMADADEQAGAAASLLP